MKILINKNILKAYYSSKCLQNQNKLKTISSIKNKTNLAKTDEYLKENKLEKGHNMDDFAHKQLKLLKDLDEYKINFNEFIEKYEETCKNKINDDKTCDKNIEELINKINKNQEYTKTDFYYDVHRLLKLYRKNGDYREIL